MENLDCTIVVPLKDNDQRTAFMLKNGLVPGVKYLFADGSKDSKNEEVIAGYPESNIKYRRYAIDETWEIYARKMSHAFDEVETSFVMTIDQGDYLVPDALIRILDAMKSTSNASCAAGEILASRLVGNFATIPYTRHDAKGLNGKEGNIGIEQISKNYNYLWYAIHQSKVLAKTWHILANQVPKYPATEFLPTVSALAQGSYIHLDFPYLLRFEHGLRQLTKQPKDFYFDTTDEGILNLRNEFLSVCKSSFPSLDIEIISKAFTPRFQIAGEQLRRKSRGPKWFRALMPDDSQVSRYPFLSLIEFRILHIHSIIRRHDQFGQNYLRYRFQRIEDILLKANRIN